MAFLRKRGNIWHLYYYDNSKGHLSNFSTRLKDQKLALTVLKKFEAEQELGIKSTYTVKPVKPLKLLEAFEQFLLHKSRKDITPKTVSAYQTAINKFAAVVGNKYLDKYTSVDYDRYIYHLKNNKSKKTDKNYSTNTVANFTRHLKIFFNWLEANKFISNNFVYRTKEAAAEPSPIPPDDLKKILDKLWQLEKVKQFHIVKLTYLCALRKSEVVKAELTDFDMKNKCIYVRNQKGKRIDTIPMIKDVEKYLQEHWHTFNQEGKIFDYKSTEGLKTFWNTVITSLSLDYKFHGLRSARISDLANAGIKPLFLQKFARHKDLRTTLKYYTVIDFNLMREDMNKCF